MNKMSCVEKGHRGEDLAVDFLFTKGYRILTRNWRIKAGEIDIIAQDGDMLVFCEVKSRSSTRFGTGAEAVDARKQRKIVQVATLYLQRYRLSNQRCRFDVIEILQPEQDQPQIQHFINAFSG
jgi:putative endonuclease